MLRRQRSLLFEYFGCARFTIATCCAIQNAASPRKRPLVFSSRGLPACPDVHEAIGFYRVISAHTTCRVRRRFFNSGTRHARVFRYYWTRLPTISKPSMKEYKILLGVEFAGGIGPPLIASVARSLSGHERPRKGIVPWLNTRILPSRRQSRGKT